MLPMSMVRNGCRTLANRIQANNSLTVVGTHFIILASLFLTTYDPTVPRMGPQMKSAMIATQVSFALVPYRRVV